MRNFLLQREERSINILIDVWQIFCKFYSNVFITNDAYTTDMLQLQATLHTRYYTW